MGGFVMKFGIADSEVALTQLPLDDNSNTNYRNLFYKAFNASPILMAISSIENGILIDINQAWLDTIGYSKEEVIGHSTEELNIFMDFQERLRVKQLIIENGLARDQEIRFLTKSGDTRYGIFSGDIIILDNHKYLLTTAYDITDRRRIQEIEQDNRILKEQLKYDKLKESFLVNISHELRTPVSIFYSSLQLFNILLKKDSSIEKNNGIEKQMNIMKQNCYRLIKLTNNLIDITKVGSGYLKLSLEDCNIVNLIRNITLSVAEFGKYNDIDIVFHSDFEEMIISCDIEKVERIVLNLLSNAIKFTPQKGNIFVNVFKDDNKVKISVKDTGIGIPKIKQKNLFRRFYQINSSLSKPNEGSGIGLSLAKSLAQLHNGDLHLNKLYKDGCEFILEIPIITLKRRKRGIGNNICMSANRDYVDTIKVEFSDIYFDN